MRRPSPDQGEERVFQTEGTEAEAALGQAGAGRWRKSPAAMCRTVVLTLRAEGIHQGVKAGDRKSLTLRDWLDREQAERDPAPYFLDWSPDTQHSLLEM